MRLLEKVQPVKDERSYFGYGRTETDQSWNFIPLTYNRII